MSKLAKALTAAAGNAGGESVYVEDVFSTYLYDGNSSTQTITNGIDLSGEGGMVWLKCRASGGSFTNNVVVDSERVNSQGYHKNLFTNLTDAQYDPPSLSSSSVYAFNSNGFSLGANINTNYSGSDNVSWSFRKQRGFFDVVTYTGTGSAQTIAHNLGSVPGMIIVKGLDIVENWIVYHSSLGETKYIQLNTTGAAGTSSIAWNDTAPTSTEFTVNTFNAVNESGYSYVAYLFASDAGGFGDDGSESIIKCGSYTTDANEDATINLGWEPQWLLVKRTDSSTAGDWRVIDSMRGWEAGGDAAYVEANTSDAEAQTGDGRYYLTSTGFKQDNFGANRDYIYIAIRRPMKTPESGTEVFDVDLSTTNLQNGTELPATPFATDMVFSSWRDSNYSTYNISRLTGGKVLYTHTTGAESSSSFFNFGYDQDVISCTGNFDSTSSPRVNYAFKRATGFFDVVAYTGTGASTITLNHNLGVIPELIIFKRRTNNTNTDAEWKVWSGNNTTDSTYFLVLDKDQAEEQQNSGLDIVSSLSSTEFTVKNAIDGTAKGQLNRSTEDYISYLFATLAGVSKVGSYTGTGSNVDVDCGFSAGAKFILIKRTDSTGDWYVWDSERGIVAGNDPYLLLNSTAAEVTSTDYIDPLSSGFTVTSSAPAALNASGGTYIFLAIA